MWQHGPRRSHFLKVLLVLTVNVVHQVSAQSDFLDRGVIICKVRAESATGAIDNLQVVALPGNVRTVDFGDGTDVETTVACTSQGGTNSEVLPPGCTAWPAGQEPVSDVSECSSCACTQDTSRGLESASNFIVFEEGIEPACRHAKAGSPVDVLLFGMGGGALQTFALQRCPKHTRVESVEADPQMAAVATKFFGVPLQDGVSLVRVDDASSAAEAFVQKLNAVEASLQEQGAARRQQRNLRRQHEEVSVPLGKKRWDVLVTDCFVGKGVTPERCRSREFLTSLRILVRPGGTILHHMWHTSPHDDSVARTFDDTVQLYKDIYGTGKVSVKRVRRAKDAQWDSVIIAQG